MLAPLELTGAKNWPNHPSSYQNPLAASLKGMSVNRMTVQINCMTIQMNRTLIGAVPRPSKSVHTIGSENRDGIDGYGRGPPYRGYPPDPAFAHKS
jgi:hypothetical protein